MVGEIVDLARLAEELAFDSVFSRGTAQINRRAGCEAMPSVNRSNAAWKALSA